MKIKIERSLNILTGDCSLELLFDWVSIRFPTTDVKHIIKNVLKINLGILQMENKAWNHYRWHYDLGDIKVMYWLSEL